MDGRCWTLLLLVTLPALGCLQREVVSGPLAGKSGPADSPSPPSALPSEKPGVVGKLLGKEPAHKPLKPETFIAMGQVQERIAADAKGQSEREQALDRAANVYRRALERDPKQIGAWQGQARVQEALGNHEEALATFGSALEKLPRSAVLWYDRGMCHARHKEWEPCLADLRQAVHLEPKNRQYLKFLGFCLARAGHYDESLAYLQRAMSDGEARLNLARMLSHLNEREAAREQALLALDAEPKLTLARQLLDELDGRAEPAPRPAALEPTSPEADRLPDHQASLPASPADSQLPEVMPESPPVEAVRFDGRLPDPAQLEGQPLDSTPAEYLPPQ